MKNIETGRRGEQAAVIYLKKAGYFIIKTNYRIKAGEIDIIAFCPKREYLVFIEVKTRSFTNGTNYGSPAEAVNFAKQRKIINVARQYLLNNNLKADNVACRFDVLEILVRKNKFEYNHIIGAFGER